MLLGLIGFVLIVSASAGVGQVASERYRRRPEELRDIRSVLQRLETQISFGAVPLPAALLEAGKAGRGAINQLFSRISEKVRRTDGTPPSEAWRAGIRELNDELHLSDEDVRTILILGESLGCSDREDQLKHIRLAVQRLDAAETLAWEERRKNENLFRVLGILGGLAVAILLL